VGTGTDETGTSCPEGRTRRPDFEIAALAARQHGVVASRQLRALGLDRYAIRYRVRIGRLHRIHEGVFSVGHPSVNALSRCIAAVLSCGPDTVASHRTAAWLWRIRDTARSGIEVTVPRWIRRAAPIECHTSRVPADERAVVDGIPVTSVPRTLLDLAAVLQPHQLERAIDQAEVLRLTDPLSLPQLLERYPGRRGAATLRTALASANLGLGITRSELEERFLRLVTKARLPRPELNAALQIANRWIEVDCLWRAQRGAVELNGRSVHGTRAAFERDRARDRRLQAEGWAAARITWRQLERDAPELEADLRTLLTS
jgi:predicted transcriptional regulator of viral defense system